MKIFGELKRIQGDEITVKIDEQANINRISTLSDGASPIIEIDVKDARQITASQRKFIFATCRDIDDWTGFERGYMRQYFKDLFEQYYGYENFSLSNCSEEEATVFINLVMEFVFKHQVQLPKGLQINLIPANEQHYFYLCLKNRICCITGKPNAEIAHYNEVGNRKRRMVDHRKLLMMALSHEKHREQHTIGVAEFLKKYHVKPIYLDEETIVKLGIMTRKRIDEIDGRS
jgi:hypothetical protein